MDTSLAQKLHQIATTLPTMQASISEHHASPQTCDWLRTAIVARSDTLARSVEATVNRCDQLHDITDLLLKWMRDQTIVRVLGAGRARLAAAIPANRLAHGGARVFIQDDIIPMPHTVKGGGVIAASASGKTNSVLEPLRKIRDLAPHITVLGIADAKADEFRSLCRYFIEIHEVHTSPDVLYALADIGEFVISEVLDSLVVAAGRKGNFDERKWKLGHENIGATGPYDARLNIDLLFNERY